jgi:hypothetical protein
VEGMPQDFAGQLCRVHDDWDAPGQVIFAQKMNLPQDVGLVRPALMLYRIMANK